MNAETLPQTHVGLTRRTWERIRNGLSRCMKNHDDCRKCIEWCQAFPDHTRYRTEISKGGHKDMITQALETEDYFELSPDAMAWWERIIQNHPFSVIFAKERYAALPEKRKE